MSTEDQLRDSLDRLDLTLPPGFAGTAKRGALRRRHRRQALVAGTGVMAIAAAGTGIAAIHGPRGGHTITVSDSTGPIATYDVDGVAFSLPDGYQGVRTSGPVTDARGRITVATFGPNGEDRDLIAVRVIRNGNPGATPPSEGATATADAVQLGPSQDSKQLNPATLVQVFGPDDASVATVMGSLKDTGPKPSRFYDVNGVLVPLPDGFHFVRRTGPDTPATPPPADAATSRSTLLMAQEGVSDEQAEQRGPGTLEVVVSTFDQAQGTIDGKPHLVGSLSVVSRLSDTRLLQVNGFGIDQDVVLDEATAAKLG